MQTFGLFDDEGAPLLGATPAFVVYADGAGAARSAPGITVIGGGLYGFTPSGSDEYVGTGYLIDGGASAEPRYYSGSAGLLVAFAFFDADGAPLAGLSPTFSVYAGDDGALVQPAIVALGGGVYAFQPTQDDRDAVATYVVIGGGAAVPAYYSGTVPLGEAQPQIPDIETMTPIARNLTIVQGSTWTRAFAVVDATGAALDLTAYTPRMQIRTDVGGGILAEPTLAVTDASGGIVTAMLTAEETRALCFDRAVYDVEIAADPIVFRVYEGEVRLLPEVTLS